MHCQIRAEAQINPSEEPKKVLQAMLNVLPECEYEIHNDTVCMSSKDINILDTIRKSMAARQSLRSLNKNLLRNVDGNATWFFLNRQAAFVKVSAICEEADESPLGPIRVTLTSSEIQDVILWLSDG